MLADEPGTDALTARSSRVVAARKLQRRRARDKAERFLAEGPQAVREAIGAGVVEDLFYDLEADARHSDLIDAAVAAGAHVHPCTDDGLAALAETVTPQGLVAVCRFLDQAPPRGADPGRGAPRHHRPGQRRDGAARCRRGRGRLRGLRDRLGRPVQRQVRALLRREPVPPAGGPRRRHGRRLDVFEHAQILAAAADGDDLYALDGAGDLAAPTVWLFGSEAHGLDEATAALAHRKVGVPIWGKAESLNLAVAAGRLPLRKRGRASAGS